MIQTQLNAGSPERDTGILRQFHLDAPKCVAPSKPRSLFSDRGYMGRAPGCQANVAIFFQPVKKAQKRGVFAAVDKSGSAKASPSRDVVARLDE